MYELYKETIFLEQGNEPRLSEKKEKTRSLVEEMFFSMTGGDKVANEIKDYIDTPNADQDTKPLEWWKGRQEKYPVLSKIARDYLAVRPTSVPSERKFSSSGLLIGDLRTNLSSEKVRELMCLKSWLPHTTTLYQSTD